MSTYHLSSEKRKGIGLLSHTLGPLLGMLLIALQLLWPVAAIAAPGDGSVDVGKNQALDLVGAAVVRLLVTYVPGQSGQLPLTHTLSGDRADQPLPLGLSGTQCTGLGVLVKSWQPQGAEDLNTWLLTDGDLVGRQRLCGNSGSTGGFPDQLASIDIYSSTTGLGSLLAHITCAGSPLMCSNRSQLLPSGGSSCPLELNCAHALVLVPFHSAYALPYAELAPLPRNSQTTFGLELTDSSGSLPAQASQAPGFLTPKLVGGQEQPVNTATSTPNEEQEAGMPMINQMGQVVGLQVLGDGTSDAGQVGTLLRGFNLLATPTNQLLTHWRAGIQDYYRNQYSQAKTEFQQVLSLSHNQLRGAQQFLLLINQHFQAQVSSQTQSPGLGGEATLLGFPLLAWAGLAGGLLLLLLILLMTLLVRRIRRRRELERFRKEEEEAKRQADLEAERQRQRVRALQARQQPLTLVGGLPQSQRQTERSEQATTSASVGPTGVLQCPACKEPVARGSEYCPACGILLSPSTSGLRLRALVPPEMPAQPMPSIPAPEAGEVQTASPAVSGSQSQSPSQSVPQPSLSDQPTFVLPPLSEQPTQAIISPSAALPAEKTQAIRGKQRMRSFQLLVGHRTDPGIKRRHKPNEDSLLAILGGRRINGQVQPWGFFVVADGMGGHANGQDASRLAIQTIVDYVLPSLVRERELSSNDYQRLLVEGVQSANQAVHEQNQREHADMGTTMTTALIVGSVAYVANVGDSRTYLYREGRGLKKVTQDHSVVASLVEAGIIKPEDIYTHPKRNQIYRSLGEKPIVEVDPFREELLPGDKLLLCSDGLWDMTRDPHIEAVLRKPADPQRLVDDLVQLALDGGGEDNISVIVVQLVESARGHNTPDVQVLAQPDQFALPTLPQG
ncbi:PP2C family serine/threonine-protein phosphatase [Thermogemmatispora sp.]|uniref:PP2C family serine/threonine-protein phosphatase n=1 Tax=Thermogemmatispora sp. TaxID=1968838 RepID=UPI001D468A71|nr:protein phosphatase 2C domain-containing protein [Thermogemmatispora sp.]MBX5449091.1 protein phosphatase 2C domain-containing protein [Thermogemmatispora sp.]